jgi:uracil phosphoribosyltransferase
MLTILDAESSITAQYLLELRDQEIQKDNRRFEHNIERLSIIAGYELSKHLNYQENQTETQLAIAKTQHLADRLVINTILRAGLPVQRGLSQVFDKAELSFIAAGRKPNTSAVEIDLAYVATPELTGKVLIIADTMLATGKSIVDSYRALVERGGQPSRVFIVGIIASQAGIDYIKHHIPSADLVVCALDKELNKKFYIVPGLGDAGDLLYGPKL